MTLYQVLWQGFNQVLIGFQNRFIESVSGNPSTWRDDKLVYFWNKVVQFQDLLSKMLAFLVATFLFYLFYRILKKVVGYFSEPFFENLLLRLLKVNKEEKDQLIFTRKFNGMITFFVLYFVLGVFIPNEGFFFSLIYNMWENLIIWQVVSLMAFLISRLYYLPLLQAMEETLPLRGVLQATSLVLYGMGLLIIFLHFANLNLSGFLAGMGAVSAVLLLIFQDSLLNLTATFRIYSNQMLKEGDWIEVPSLGCEGTVQEVTLGAIKVQNFDMSVSSFSPKNLVAGSFKNWSNMITSGARRSTQLIWIDLHSVINLNQDELDAIRKIPFFQDFWKAEGETVVQAHNYGLSNVRLFRSYLLHYLKNHPLVHADMAIFVRNQEVTDKGLPIQILFYCTRTQTQDFEEVRADVLEHAFAVIREFYLAPYQSFSDSPPKQLN